MIECGIFAMSICCDNLMNHSFFTYILFFRLISRYNNDSLLNLSLLVQERLSLSAVQPVQVRVIISSGTCRHLEKLLNSWFIMVQTVSLGFQVVSVGVDLVVQTLITLWPSVESRLKMQEITTVSRVWALRSHSVRASYKNLPQLKRNSSDSTAAKLQRLLYSTVL